MGKLLTAEQVAAFDRDGFVLPVQVLPPEEAARLLSAYEDYERRYWGYNDRAFDDDAGREFLRQPQRQARWAYDLVTHPGVLDGVEDLLGPDIMVWESKLFVKPPHSESIVTWHQDGTYVGLDPVEKTLTAWIALTGSGPENGCMRYVPGSHKWGQLSHAPANVGANLLQFGQAIERSLDSEPVVDAILQPGEMTIHHSRVVHGSLPNISDRKRVGLSVFLVTPDVVESHDRRAAILARGVDRYGRFQRFEWPRGVPA